MIRRPVVALVALAALLAGCGGGETVRATSGPLVEVRPPQGGGASTRPRGPTDGSPAPSAAPRGGISVQTLGPPGSASGAGGKAAAVVPAPAAAGRPQRVEVRPGETLYALARRYNVPVRSVIELNRLTPPFALRTGQMLELPQNTYHTVQPGETLYAISRRYGIDNFALAQANQLSPPYGIQVGQQIAIPSNRAPAPAATEVAAIPPVPAPAPPPPAAATPGAPPHVLVAPPTPSARPSAVPPVEPPPAVAAAETAPVATAPEEPSPAPAPQQTAALAVPPPAEPQAAAPPPEPEEAPAPAIKGTGQFSWPVKGRVLSGYGPTADGLHNDGINIAARKGEPVRAADGGTVVYAGDGMKGFGHLVLIRHANGFVTAYAHNDVLLVRKGASVRRGQIIARAGQSGGVSEPQVHFEIRKGVQAVNPLALLEPASA